MQIQLPALSFHDLTLSPADDLTRSKAIPALDAERVVRIGGPLSLPITLEDLADDDRSRPFLTALIGEWSFYQLHVACSIYPPGDLRLKEVSLEFALRCQDPNAPAPIALSMAPDRTDKRVDLSQSITLGAKLNVIDAGYQQTRTSEIEHVYVEALNPLRDDPLWRLYRTPLTEIKGAHRFVMVVQAPKERSYGSLTVNVEAEYIGLFRYKAVRDDGASIDFTFRD